jgi:hypothetical protein
MKGELQIVQIIFLPPKVHRIDRALDPTLCYRKALDTDSVYFVPLNPMTHRFCIHRATFCSFRRQLIEKKKGIFRAGFPAVRAPGQSQNSGSHQQQQMSYYSYSLLVSYTN